MYLNDIVIFKKKLHNMQLDITWWNISDINDFGVHIYIDVGLK